MFSRVLLCSDGSEQALNAAGAAAEISKRFGGHITALHVFQVPVAPVAAVGAVGLDSAMLEPPNEGVQDAVVQRTSAALESVGAAYTIRRELGFSPAEVILRVANEEQSELIVLGSHGAGAVERFLLGSISDRVVHHAHCAVLIVK